MDHAHGPAAIRYCSNCGGEVAERSVEGKTRPVCTRCDRVHYREAKVAVAAAVVSGGKLLLVKRRYPPEQGKWGLPGGYLDPGEDPAVAAARETREETGVILERCELLDVLFNAEPGGADISVVYEAVSRSATPVAGDDAEHAVFFDLDELPELAFKSTSRAVERLRAILARTSR